MDFDRARFKSFVRDVFSWFTHTENNLLPFDEVRRLPLKGQHDLGYREIPLDHVIGSVGRYQDFDRGFLPRQQYIKSRWMNIDRARMQEIALPPIDLYKVGEVYFVRDGNHRVSVAREQGQLFIDAYVTEINVQVDFTPKLDLREFLLKQLYASFLEETHIKDFYPSADLQLSPVGEYDTLLEHIRVHQWFMGNMENRQIDYEQAVCSWYEKVYLPIVYAIREKEILRDFPGRTEADLYIWISEHHWFLTERRHGYVNIEEAAIHFVNKFSRKPIRRLRYEIGKILRTIRKYFREEDSRNPNI
jgi:hypothetical protein